MYEIRMTRTFRRDTERCRKRGYDMELLKRAIRALEADGVLPASYRAHKLVDHINCRVTMQDVGNAILKATGCWCGNKMTAN